MEAGKSVIDEITEKIKESLYVENGELKGVEKAIDKVAEFFNFDTRSNYLIATAIVSSYLYDVASTTGVFHASKKIAEALAKKEENKKAEGIRSLNDFKRKYLPKQYEKEMEEDQRW